MTQDFAKPSTTRKPGDKKKTGSKSSAKTKPTKKKGSKKTSSATIKKAQTEQPLPPKNKLLPILSLIVLISAFSYGLYHLQSVPPTQSIPSNAKKIEHSKQQTQDKTVVKKPDARFKFYDLLPESNITPPKVETYRFKAKNKQGDYIYYVQTGSFRNKSDAERQKATIAFQGIKAKIKVITSDSGTKWYRVTAGPYTNRSKMNGVLDKLVAINIQPLVKKTKKK